ncbi:unnamed protein product [Trichobilharzia regenti]|nr:unnamed protein product [Trichobilharzia regenti]
MGSGTINDEVMYNDPEENSRLTELVVLNFYERLSYGMRQILQSNRLTYFMLKIPLKVIKLHVLEKYMRKGSHGLHKVIFTQETIVLLTVNICKILKGVVANVILSTNTLTQLIADYREKKISESGKRLLRK